MWTTLLAISTLTLATPTERERPTGVGAMSRLVQKTLAEAKGPATPPLPPPPAPATLPLVQGMAPLPQLPARERARYTISYGLLGDVGSVEIELDGRKASGRGAGSVFGMAELERTLESALDPTTLVPQRWTSTKTSADRSITDVATRVDPGVVSLLRKRTDRADDARTLATGTAVLDPLSFLAALRLRPPAEGAVYLVLDGRALWRMTVKGVERGPLVARVPRAGNGVTFHTEARPVTWEGFADEDRPTRNFALTLTDDAYRTPWLLRMNVGLADVEVRLVDVDRPSTPVAKHAGFQAIVRKVLRLWRPASARQS